MKSRSEHHRTRRVEPIDVLDPGFQLLFLNQELPLATSPNAHEVDNRDAENIVQKKEQKEGIGKRLLRQIATSPLTFCPEYIGFGTKIMRNNLSCNLHDVANLRLFTLPRELYPVNKPIRSREGCALGSSNTPVYRNQQCEPTAQLLRDTWGMVDSEKIFPPEDVARLRAWSAIASSPKPSEKFRDYLRLDPESPHARLFPIALFGMGQYFGNCFEIKKLRVKNKKLGIIVNFFTDRVNQELLVCFASKNKGGDTFLEAFSIQRDGFPEGMKFASLIAEITRDHLKQIGEDPNNPAWSLRLIGTGIMGSLVSYAGARNQIPFTVFNPFRISDQYLPDYLLDAGTRLGEVYLIEGSLSDPRHPERPTGEKRLLRSVIDASFIGQVYLVPREYRPENEGDIVNQPDRFFKNLLNQITRIPEPMREDSDQELQLSDSSPEPFMDLMDQCRSHRPDLQTVIQVLREDPSLINVRDPVSGQTPLMVQAKNKYFQPGLTRVLLDFGADVRLKDNQGRTAIHLACNHRSPNPEIVLLLLKCGADYPNLAKFFPSESGNEWLAELKQFSDVMSDDFMNLYNDSKFSDTQVTVGDEKIGVIRKLFVHRTGIDPVYNTRVFDGYDPEAVSGLLFWVYSGYALDPEGVEAICRAMGIDYKAHDGIDGFRKDMKELYGMPGYTKDFAILTRDKEMVRMDRFVLGARSGYFHRLLGEISHNTEWIRDPLNLSANSWHVLIRWMYTDEIDYPRLVGKQQDRDRLLEVLPELQMNGHETNEDNPHSFRRSIQEITGTNGFGIFDVELYNRQRAD